MDHLLTLILGPTFGSHVRSLDLTIMRESLLTLCPSAEDPAAVFLQVPEPSATSFKKYRSWKELCTTEGFRIIENFRDFTIEGGGRFLHQL